MGVDPSWDHELPARLVHLLSGQRIKADRDFGDPPVGCRANIGRSLAAGIDHYSTSYQHDQILLVRAASRSPWRNLGALGLPAGSR